MTGTATAVEKNLISPKLFVRRTSLTKEEKRVNFKQIDRDAIEVVTSREACRHSPLMCKIYLRLVNAGTEYLEKDGVLRLTGCEKDGRWMTAWEQLLGLLEVASATAIKALTWMHQQGVIGYDAHKNGVGIRIFLNRAQASIAPVKILSPMAQKNLDFSHTSFPVRPASSVEVPFNLAGLDMLESDINPDAQKNCAKEINLNASLCQTSTTFSETKVLLNNQEPAIAKHNPPTVTVDEIVRRLKIELEPCVKAATVNAIAREHLQTREWFETKALPKAVRVAQKESYALLRTLGGREQAAAKTPRPDSQVGKYQPSSAALKPLRARTREEIIEVAEMCLALHEVQGKSIEATLWDISAENGGWLLAEDQGRVRLAVGELLSGMPEKNRWSNDVKLS